MKLSDKAKGISRDLIYSITGIAVMNGVIQLALYPYLQRALGTEVWGHILTLLAVVSLMSSSFGTGANYSRMLSRVKGYDSDIDYKWYLLYTAAFAAVVALAALTLMHMSGIFMFFAYYLLMVVSIFRYYADVQFRLTIDYKRYCFFYILIALGYLAGIAVYPLCGSWQLVLLSGELIAVLYVLWRGTIFRGGFRKSTYYGENIKSAIQLTGTQLLANLVFNSDRLLLEAYCGGTSVTVFYVATLIGKIVSLISAPLNGVIIGYLSRYKGTVKKHFFIKLGLCCIPAAAILTLFCTGASYIFVRIVYPDVFADAAPYLLIASMGQVIFFLSGTFIVILMRFAAERYQLYVNFIYVFVFFACAIPLTKFFLTWGMAIAILAANLCRITAIVFLGENALKKTNKQEENTKE